MGKPTEQELEQALVHARLMREQGKDPHFLAKAFLNCHYQSTFLLAVMNAAEEYLRSGLAEREHTRLVMAIDKAREIDIRSANREPPTSLGL